METNQDKQAMKTDPAPKETWRTGLLAIVLFILMCVLWGKILSFARPII